MLKKCLKNFFRNFDYFGVAFTFKYKGQERYRTATGGICFLLFLGVAVTYGLIIGIPIMKRKKLTVIDYVMQIAGTEVLNFHEYGSSVAVGVSSCSTIKNLSEMLELFTVEMKYVQHIEDNGTKVELEEPVEFELCTYANFFNKLNQSFDTHHLDKVFCPKHTNYTITGIITDPLYKYIQVTVKARVETEEAFEKIKKIFADECSLAVFYIDFGFDVFNYNEPVYMFINKNSMYLKFSEVMKLDVFFKLVQFDSYENFFFDNYKRTSLMSFSGYDLYSNYKGESRFKDKPVDYNVFAKIFFKADHVKEKIERKYTKLTEFAANVSSILSAVLLFMFLLVTFINKFYANESVIHRIFQFNFNTKKGKKRSDNLRRVITKNVYLFEAPEEKMNSKEISIAHTDSIRRVKSTGRIDTQESFKNMKVDTDLIKQSPDLKVSSSRKYPLKSEPQPPTPTIYYNLLEVLFILICPRCSWRLLKKKNILFRKAIEKLYFQLDVLNYIKHMQQLEILNYSILEPNENIIVQFLSKPSISLAQKKDVYDKIRSVTDININEANELYSSIKQLYDKKEKSNFQKRLLKLTRGELGKLIKKIKVKEKQ